MSFCKSVLLSFGIIINICAYAQSASPLQEETTAVPPHSISSKFLDNTSSKASQIAKKLEKKTTKALLDLQSQESRIQRKLAEKDSLKAASIFGDAKQQYTQLEQKLKKQNSLQEYIPGLDSMSSTLKFLQQNPQMLSNAKDGSQKLEETIGKVKAMEGQFQKAEEIKRFLKERRQYLKEQLQHVGFAKKLKHINKQAYYYSEQITQYKSLLKDHKKAERKALELLSQTKAFQEFIQKNSYLGQLFSLPGNYSTTQSLTGLQTRAQVQQMVAQQVGSTSINGVDPRQYVQGQMQQAQQQLDQLKDKIGLLGLDGGGGDLVMPEFKPNKQRTKPFLRRLEYGFDLQNQRNTSLLPVTSDFALSVGYKLNDKSILGIGSSYKMGWGSGIRNLKITNQGIGLRSYIDIKAKGSIWINGGFEYNYMKQFEGLTDIANPDVWQKSGLIGFSKKYRIAKNKQGNIQLLYDFLADQQLPRGQALKFRIGYRF